MVWATLVLAGVLATAAAAAQQTPETTGRTIVVTGVSLAETEARLKDCVARKCPVDADVDAALAHAENQFVAGDYLGARATLNGAIRRDKRYARQFPVAVSDLMRAKGRIEINLGNIDGYRFAMIASLDAAKAGLPEQDSHVLITRMELADALVAAGTYRIADDLYRDTIATARRSNLPALEGRAMLRRASLFTQLALARLDARSRAEAAIDALLQSRQPAHRLFALAARVLRARLRAREGDSGAIDTLLAEMRGQPTDTPLLLYAPPIEISQKIASAVSTDERDPAWVDMIFWVTPEGIPADIDFARHARSFDPAWAAPIAAAIRARRYAPLHVDADAPGALRVERYTLVHRNQFDWGARRRHYDNRVHVEYVDLTVDRPAPRPAQ